MTRAIVSAILAVSTCVAAWPFGEVRAFRAQARALSAQQEQTVTSPPDAAPRFDLGRRATPDEIARLDIDVMPDGRGLPAGRGTAREGGVLYATRCAACHGENGEGTPRGDVLIGRRPDDGFDFAASVAGERLKTIGNYWPYATTLFDYTRRAMPFDRPGSLRDDEVYALVAWLLWRNRIIAEDTVMDATTLPAVRMPARGRFVADDRETSTLVR